MALKRRASPSQPIKTAGGLDKRHKDILAQGDKLFTDRAPLMSLWQEIADNFYPERADFTVTRSLGKDFAGNLTTSYPLLVRRELGDSFGSILRPTEKVWFHTRTQMEPIPEDARQWLEWAEGTQRRAMYDPDALFLEAMKQADHDYAAFGQCVLTIEFIRHPMTGAQLLYRCHHLRDTVWGENAFGVIDTVQRKIKLPARSLVRLFGKERVHRDVLKFNDEDPFREVNFRHIVVPADEYETDKKSRFGFVSLYIDTDNMHVMEEMPRKRLGYVIPRWQKAGSASFGCQYAYSPAVIAGLPDARLVQEMNFTLLEAGQVTVRPPMVAVEESIRSAETFAGGWSWVDSEFEGKLEDAVRPLYETNSNGIPIGMELIQAIEQRLARAFYLNQIAPPLISKDPRMTAFQAGQIIQEYIRKALPLFEPMETQYSGGVCNETFDVMLDNHGFGHPDQMPRFLSDQTIQFRFESPLHDALESVKPQKFLEAKQLIAEAAAFYPIAPRILNASVALRDALHAVAPASWLETEDSMLVIEEQEAQKAAMQAVMGTVSQGAQVAQQIGDATASVRQGMAPAEPIPAA